MRVMIVASRFPPQGEVGGIEIASQNISKHLSKNGNEVFVVAFGKKNITEKIRDNLVVYRLAYPKIKILGNMIFWLKIFFTAEKIKPDIIHCQTIQMGLPCFLFKKIYKKPYVVWCHGFDVYFPWKFKKIISKIVLNSAGAVVVLTEDMRNELKKNFKKDILVLPNGVDLEKFKGFSKKILRDKLKIPLDKKVILFAGELKKVKGSEYLIEAFKKVSENNSETRLILVGDGSEREKLENIAKKIGIEERINFIGRVSNQGVLEYMAAADIFVLPSLSEGFPLVVLEAMASGLPIVATKVRGISEILKDNENGFLVSSENSEQLFEKIMVLLENDMLIERMSDYNKNKAEEYNWENVVRKIEEIYLRVIN